MKTRTILKGFHRPLSLIPACFKFISFDERFSIKKKVVFTESCRYNFDNDDQLDWNKLFGFCLGINGVHKNSARIVWRYKHEADKIELAAYYYINGIRICRRLTTVEINRVIDLEIVKSGHSIFFNAYGFLRDHDIIESNKPVFGCGLYFGGNRRAPHNITIKMCNYD